MLSIPNDSGSWEPTHSAAASRRERPRDRIVVGEIHLLPRAVIKVSKGVGHCISEIAIGAHGGFARVFQESIAGWHYPGLDAYGVWSLESGVLSRRPSAPGRGLCESAVAKVDRDTRRITLGEPPVIINEHA